ncbi:MAG: DUF2029 domain-containing protein [Actinobacteria bacterium]|nr:DUF2029 domain-containing protein [Actinomycetota bacterium]
MALRRLSVFAVLSAVVVSLYRGALGDYPNDAARAVDALAGGHLLRALTVRPQPLMGPVSVVVRAPFAAIAHALGGGDLVAYRAGAIPCLVAAGLLAVWLLRVFPARRPVMGLLVVLLAVGSPAAVNALDVGHPEEVLAAALTVAGVVAAMRSRTVAAAVLLGLALATKQWAVIALPPAMLAVGRPKWRLAAGAVGLAALLTVPQAIADPHGFASMSRHAATATNDVFVQSWWSLVAHTLPGWLAQLTHPAIVLAAVPVTILAARRGVRADGVLPLLALLFLIRCVFDPVDNFYYHLPLLLALLAWDLQTRRTLPWATLGATLCLVETNSFLAGTQASVFYFVWTAILGATLAGARVRLSRASTRAGLQAPA